MGADARHTIGVKKSGVETSVFRMLARIQSTYVAEILDPQTVLAQCVVVENTCMMLEHIRSCLGGRD